MITWRQVNNSKRFFSKKCEQKGGIPLFQFSFKISPLWYITRLFTRLIMAAAACCLSLFLLPAIVLQTCAFFSPYWIKNNATSECVRGLIYNSDCSGDVAGLGAAILGLQVIFFLLILLTTVSSVYLFCCKGKDSDEGCCSKICGTVCCLRSLSGIFGFSGCMVIVADYGDHDKGRSSVVVH